MASGPLQPAWAGTHYLLALLVTSGQYFLPDCNVKAQVGPSDFEHPKNKSHGFLAFITGAGAALCVCPSSHKFVFYARIVKNTLVRNLILDEIMIPLDSNFVWHGFL